MAKTKLYTIYMGLYEACVQNGISGGYQSGYIHAVFKPAVQQGAEIWTVHRIFLPREAYYSSQVSRIFIASEFVELSALETDGTIERCGCGFQAAQLVSPLLYQPWLTLETMMHAEMQDQMLS